VEIFCLKVRLRIFIVFFVFILTCPNISVAIGDDALTNNETIPLNLKTEKDFSNTADKIQNPNLPFRNVPEISIMNLFFKIVIVLAIVYLFFFIVRKIMSKKRMLAADSNLFQTLAVYPLAANKTLHLVEFSDEIYLLGVSENSINLLDKITERDKIDSIKLYTDMINVQGASKNFMDFVVGAFSKKNSKTYDLKDFKHINDYDK